MIENSPRTPLMSVADWHRAGQRFNYRGHDIFYAKSAGTHREVLLLIHGFPTASWDYSAVWARLSQRFQLIAPDLIGFGFSAKPADYDYSIHDQASLCEALLTQLGVREYHILAHDYGDTVAQELLARHHEDGFKTPLRPQLKSVCFLNGGLFPETHRPLMAQRLLLSPFAAWIARHINKEKFAANMLAIAGSEYPPTSVEIDGFWSLISHNNGLQVFPKLIRYIRERRQFRARWVGALIKTGTHADAQVTPIRLIDGAADPISGEHMAKRYGALVPNADCILLNGIGHYPQIEVPVLLVDLFLNFHDTRVAASRHQS